LARACSDWPRTVGDWRRGSSQRRHLQFYHWLGRKVKRKSRREERRQASKGEKAAGAGRCWDRSGLLLRPVPRSRRGDAFFLRPLAVATWPAAAGRPSFPSSLPDFALSHAKPCSVSPLPFVMPCSVLGSTPTVLLLQYDRASLPSAWPWLGLQTRCSEVTSAGHSTTHAWMHDALPLSRMTRPTRLLLVESYL
jgi:hypothetical protein